MDLDAVRAGLPVLDRLAYLNAGTNGPLPRRTVEAMRATLARDLEQGRSSQAYFEAMLARRDDVRAALARFLGAPAETIALTTSTTEGCNVVLNGLGIGPGDEVVTTDSEHPGLFGGARRLRSGPAGRAGTRPACRGARRRARRRDHGADEADRALARLVAHGRRDAGRKPRRTRDSRCSSTEPRRPARCRSHVADLGCDFYTVSAQKWLLGPDVTGALFVRPERVEELRMAMPSYGSWEFGDDYTYDPKAGAARFDPGWIAAASGVGLLESLAFARGSGGGEVHPRRRHGRAPDAHARRIGMRGRHRARPGDARDVEGRRATRRRSSSGSPTRAS